MIVVTAPKPGVPPPPDTDTIATVDELKKRVEFSPDRNDMTVLAAEVKPDGRVRWVRQTLFGGHLIVDEWIPKDARRGMRCTGDWWYGVGGGGKGNVTPPPDPAHRALLERFCASVRLP